MAWHYPLVDRDRIEEGASKDSARTGTSFNPFHPGIRQGCPILTPVLHANAVAFRADEYRRES